MTKCDFLGTSVRPFLYFDHFPIFDLLYLDPPPHSTETLLRPKLYLGLFGKIYFGLFGKIYFDQNLLRPIYFDQNLFQPLYFDPNCTSRPIISPDFHQYRSTEAEVREPNYIVRSKRAEAGRSSAVEVQKSRTNATRTHFLFINIFILQIF